MTSRFGVSGPDIARMRVWADGHATVNVHVYRRSNASDSKGGSTVTLTRITSVRGRRAPLTTVQSALQVYADRLGGNQGWWLTLPAGTDVRLNDRLVSGGRNFDVVGTDLDRSEDISLRCLCREVT